MIKTRKRSKRTRERGSRTCYWGGRKKHKGTGMRGGAGMAGTGKKSGQKVTWVQKNFGNDYFGGEGLKRKTVKLQDINLRDIEINMASLIKQGKAKEGKNGVEVDFSGYKILGDGDIKTKMIIIADKASESVKEKVKKAGGSLILKEFGKDQGRFEARKENKDSEKSADSQTLSQKKSAQEEEKKVAEQAAKKEKKK